MQLNTRQLLATCLSYGFVASESDHTIDVLTLSPMQGSIVNLCHCSFTQRLGSHKASPVTIVNTMYATIQLRHN